MSKRDITKHFNLPKLAYQENANEEVLDAVFDKMKDNFPFHHPLYAGQMLKPPHPVAQKAYAMAMQLNPNNHALDGGKASSDMEKEAVTEIASMVGFKNHLGHLTGGGTMANLEALWIASKERPGKRILASEQSHYTHSRITSVLNIPFNTVASDLEGRMDVNALIQEIEKGDVGTVVVTMGTTSSGSIDPLAEILPIAKTHDVRIHIDAAYGGYFKLVAKTQKHVQRHFSFIDQADSLVIDPHKHGMQPYGCGCILFNNPEVGKYYKHDSPYTYFSSKELHLGEISLECSRPGAAAVALWATQKQFPLIKSGEFSKNLDNSILAARELYTMLKFSSQFLTFFPPELDIVLWAPKGSSLSAISESSQLLFDACADQDLHLALYKFPSSQLPSSWDDIEKDQETVTCLRACLMKPEHRLWIKHIFELLESLLS